MNTHASHLPKDSETPVTSPQLPETEAVIAKMQKQTSELLLKMMKGKEELQKLQEIITALRASGDEKLTVFGDMIEQSRDVNVVDRDEWTVLMGAARWGHTEIVKLLLAREDVDVNVVDAIGQTVLMEAALNGNTEIVKLLLAREDVDVNRTDMFGQTALMWTARARKGQTEIIKTLLAHRELKLALHDQ